MCSMRSRSSCCASRPIGCGRSWSTSRSGKKTPSKPPLACGSRPLNRGRESALVVQRGRTAGKPGRQVFHVLLGKLRREALHDRVVAPAALVVPKRLHEVVVILTGEHRLIGRRGLVAFRAMARAADLRCLFLALLGVSAGEGVAREQGRSQSENERFHFPASFAGAP